MRVLTGLLSIGLIFVLVGTVAGAGIGISPAKLNYENVLRGGSLPAYFIILNNADEDIYFNLSIKDTDVSEDWFSFEPSSPVKVPGKGNTKVKAVVNPPSDTPSGVYEATIYISSTSTVEGEEGSAVMGVIPGMGLQVAIAVTGEELVSGLVKSASIANTEVNYPLRIEVEFQNIGNVLAMPLITVEISKDGEPIDSVISSETSVKPGVTDNITVTWDTTGQHVGTYAARVTVSLGEDTLYMQDLAFDILETGTLTRTGELTDLCCESEPRVGELVKVLATFRNTGAIDTKAKFSGEAYRNGKLLETIASEELEVPVTETRILTSYYKFDEPGTYKISGSVVYEGKQTATKEVLFEVPGGAATSAQHLPLTPTIVGIGLAVALIVIFGVVLLRRRR